MLPSEEELERDEGEADAVSEAWLVWSHVKDENPDVAAKVSHMQDMVHSTRDPYDNEVKTGVTTYACTSTGIDAFAASFDNPDGDAGRASANATRSASYFQCSGDHAHRFYTRGPVRQGRPPSSATPSAER